MNCKHEKTRKLFWLNQGRGKWIRTDYGICLDWDKIVGLSEVKIEEKDNSPSIQDKTKYALRGK